MESETSRPCLAFSESKKIASGGIAEVAILVKEHLKKHPSSNVLIFDRYSSDQIEVDLRGSREAILRRLEALSPPRNEPEAKGGPGRPKLGVIAREVTLLPQHWEWLGLQPGGASATLRKLVESAKKKNHAKDEIRRSQNAVYKFMTVMAGDAPGYEEALRALYAQERDRFITLVAAWPKDIRDHIRELSKEAFGKD